MYDKELQEILDKIKKYAPNADVTPVIKAYELAKSAHAGVFRKSGEPYIIHPIAVANILADLELDMEVIAAGLLHDVVEDTPYTYEDIKELFGKDIADLVDGVTKLGKIKYQTKEESQAENLRKMFLAMAKDIRVILIKLADRLHNMRTLKYMPEEKAKYKAKETLEIYGGIAHRIGISKIKWELEDLALKYIDPEGYRELAEKITMKRSQRQEYIDKIVHLLEEKFKEVNEAYEVLSDATKRQNYDQFGHEGVNGQGGFGGFGGQGFSGGGFEDMFGDIFGDMFGGGFSGGSRQRRRGPERGADIKQRVNISFEEAAFGKKVQVKINRSEECDECHGSGAKPATSKKT